MNATELKMIDYMQSILDYVKSLHEDEDYKTDELLRDTCRLCLDRFEHCGDMFEAVTGKAVTYKNWKVVVSDEEPDC